MQRYFSDDAILSRPLNAVAAGTTTQNGTGIDMAGFDGLLFIAAVGALTANQVTSLKAQQSDDDGSADDYSDIEDSSSGALADTDGNKMMVLDVFRPTKRYVRPVVVRGTANAVIDGVIAIRYHAKDRPVTQSTAVAKHTKIADADEGTA